MGWPWPPWSLGVLKFSILFSRLGSYRRFRVCFPEVKFKLNLNSLIFLAQSKKNFKAYFLRVILGTFLEPFLLSSGGRKVIHECTK